MSCCLAFNKKGKPCRNHGQIVSVSKDGSTIKYSPTCRAHRHYFKSKANVAEWKTQILFQFDGYSYPRDETTLRQHIVYMLLNAIDCGLVRITVSEDLVENIQLRHFYFYDEPHKVYYDDFVKQLLKRAKRF